MKGYILFSRGSANNGEPLPLSIHYDKRSATEQMKKFARTVKKVSGCSYEEAKQEFFIEEVKRLPK